MNLPGLSVLRGSGASRGAIVGFDALTSHTCSKEIEELHLLHGRQKRSERKRVLERLDQLEPQQPRLILASGKLIGEGFDHPPLDTLFLTLPLSWKGTLQQYEGRLHRVHDGKERVRIHDYIDSGHPQLKRMWAKRLAGYNAMG